MNDRIFRRALAKIPRAQRGPVEVVALRLIDIGGYHGSETDAITDAVDVVGALLPHLDWPSLDEPAEEGRLGDLLDIMDRMDRGESMFPPSVDTEPL